MKMLKDAELCEMGHERVVMRLSPRRHLSAGFPLSSAAEYLSHVLLVSIRISVFLMACLESSILLQADSSVSLLPIMRMSMVDVGVMTM